MFKKEKPGQANIEGENVTKYGEFVCTTHEWITLDKQKERAEEIENITKKSDNMR